MSREGHIPLCSHVYPGNRVDAKSFPDSLTRIRERLETLSLAVEDVTLVYDTGNLSKVNQQLVDAAPFGYVVSLVPAHHPALMKIPVADYHPLSRESSWRDPRLAVDSNDLGPEANRGAVHQ